MYEIVTKAWLTRRLRQKPCGCEDQCKGFCDGNGGIDISINETIRVLGRALVAIYQRQTTDEQANISTKYRNGVGFSGPDTRLGTLGARKFLATGTLPEWLAKVWLVEKNGYPRICKYAGQLNEIANENKRKSAIQATTARSYQSTV